MPSAREDRPIGVARQGIYDRDGRVIGYELLFRLPPQRTAPHLATEAEHEEATAGVIRAVLEDQVTSSLGNDSLLFVNVPRAFVVGGLPATLSTNRVVVEVLEHIIPDDALLDGVRDLRRRGFRIAVDDWTGEPDRLELISLAQYVKIDMSQVLPEALPSLVALVRSVAEEVQIVVERVEAEVDLQQALSSGADLFQGFHLQSPEYLVAG